MPRLEDLLAGSERFLQVKGGCGICPRALRDYVPPTLRTSRLILVGEAPGETEVQTQQGFTGKSGQVLRNALRDYGIDPDTVAWSNTIHCRPPGNADPEPEEISCCMNQHVMGEVEPFPLIALVGKIATAAFFPDQAKRVRGNLAYHPDFPNARIFSMLHPASIGYDGSRRDEFYQQVDRLARIYRGDTEAKFKMVTGAEFRARWAQFLRESYFLSFDLETKRLETWLQPHEDLILSLAACSTNSEEVFVLDRGDPYFDTALDELAKYLQDPEKQVLGQNIGFDLVCMEAVKRFKCNLKYIHDIASLYYQLKQEKWISLKPLVADELDGYRHLVAWPHKEKNVHRLKLYNSEDVYHPMKLFLKDFPRLRAQTQDLFLRVSGPSSLATARITHAGIHFRASAWEALDKEFETARETTIAKWEGEQPAFSARKYITEKGFRNLESYMYEVRGYPVINKTPTGIPQTDEATIKEIIRMEGQTIQTGSGPMVVRGTSELSHCLTIKSIDKRRSTYIKAYPKLIAPDRRIHASYNYTATTTGRLSSSNPNMQNIPRPEYDLWQNQIRWLFGSAPGNKMLFGDFSQIELRIAMALSNDPVGRQVYLSGGDIHIQTAKYIMQGEPSDPEMWKKDKKWKDARTKAKSANFALLYDGTWYTVQQYAMNEFGLLMTQEDAEKWHYGFFDTYKGLHPWHDAERQKLQDNKGFVESAVGHVWFHPNWDHKDTPTREHEERAAINSTCQGPAAYMMNYLIYRTQQAFWQNGIQAVGLTNAEVVQTVHDSLAAEVEEQQAEQASGIVHHELGFVYDWVKPWFTVPLVLDLDIGTVWEGEKS